MNTLKFKTSIHCGGCIGVVTPHLNKEQSIQKWTVDTENPNKILTVETESSPETIIQIIQGAGFTIEQLN